MLVYRELCYFVIKTFFWKVVNVKLVDKERFDKEQIGVKEPIPMTNFPIYLDKEHLSLRNNFRVTRKFLITMFDCNKKSYSIIYFWMLIECFNGLKR